MAAAWNDIVGQRTVRMQRQGMVLQNYVATLGAFPFQRATVRSGRTHQALELCESRFKPYIGVRVKPSGNVNDVAADEIMTTYPGWFMTADEYNEMDHVIPTAVDIDISASMWSAIRRTAAWNNMPASEQDRYKHADFVLVGDPVAIGCNIMSYDALHSNVTLQQPRGRCPKQIDQAGLLYMEDTVCTARRQSDAVFIAGTELFTARYAPGFLENTRKSCDTCFLKLDGHVVVRNKHDPGVHHPALAHFMCSEDGCFLRFHRAEACSSLQEPMSAYLCSYHGQGLGTVTADIQPKEAANGRYSIFAIAVTKFARTINSMCIATELRPDAHPGTSLLCITLSLETCRALLFAHDPPEAAAESPLDSRHLTRIVRALRFQAAKTTNVFGTPIMRQVHATPARIYIALSLTSAEFKPIGNRWTYKLRTQEMTIDSYTNVVMRDGKRFEAWLSAVFRNIRTFNDYIPVDVDVMWLRSPLPVQGISDVQLLLTRLKERQEGKGTRPYEFKNIGGRVMHAAPDGRYVIFTVLCKSKQSAATEAMYASSDWELHHAIDHTGQHTRTLPPPAALIDEQVLLESVQESP